MPPSPDPANDDIITGEFWAHVGDDGAIVQSRESFTRSDGTLLQETVYADETTTVIHGPDSPANPPTGCVAEGASPPPPGMLPPFAADPATLTQLGFIQIGVLTQDLPETPSLPDVQPVRTYASEGAVQGWEQRETLDDGRTIVRRLGIDASGRVVFDQGQLTDASGTVVEENRQVFGALEIYDLISIPEAVFAISEQAREVCGE